MRYFFLFGAGLGGVIEAFDLSLLQMMVIIVAGSVMFVALVSTLRSE